MDASTIISATKWIGSWLIREGKFLYGVQDQVRRLQDELECMIGLSEESDQAQQQAGHQEGDQQLVIFTKKIRQIAFQAEDVIDSYILQVASKSEGAKLLTRCACFLSNSPLIHETGNQIKAIIEDAKEANDRLNRYKVVARSFSTTRSRPVMLESYAHIEDEIVIGFDDHVQTLVEQLTDANNETQVIGIVGTGGAGKSTLARKVFHHLDVTIYFKYKAWVSISQQWDRRDVLYEILRNTRGINENEKNWSDRELIEKVYHFLNEERYLIVLDDTWETEAWDEISGALPPPHKGSKIIITTRMLRVPSYADPNCFVLEPRLLDNEGSWELFRKIAITGRNATPSDIMKFEKLGMEMVAKCGGLPLAIVTLAGLLRAQKSMDDWEHINKACGDKILDYGRVNKIIALSYHSLPCHLKPCFLYLGVYPEDVEISAGLLTQLWIAEGLVREDQQRGQEILEDVAKRFLDELVRRCILQTVRRSLEGNVKLYRLHDLLRDFCVAKAKDQSFLEVFASMDQSALDAKIPSLQARRVAFHSRISLPTQNRYLRSLIRFGKSGPYIVENVDYYEKVGISMNHVYKNFKLLRVLNLWGIETSSRKISEEIGNMIHLRYLAIKATNVDIFPKAVGNLINLLTLDFQGNTGKGKIAFTLSNMTRIRHLYLGQVDKISSEKFGLDKLKDLQTLKGITAGNWMIKEMTGLSRDVQRLQLCKLNSMEQLNAVYRCPSIMFGSLRSLYLDWLDDENLKLDLEKLENCQHLKKLTLDGRINGDNAAAKSLRFPPNIVHLEVRRSHLQRQDWITTLGELPNLKFLHLGPMSYEGTKLNVRTCAFPQLKVLMLHMLPSLEECRIEEGALPRLKDLSISSCLKFQRLPDELRAITTLQQLFITGMLPTFCKRLGWQEDDGVKDIIFSSINSRSRSSKTTDDGSGSRRRSGEDFHIIQHVPTTKILDVAEDEQPE